MCVPILKSIGSELTSCDAKTLHHASWGIINNLLYRSSVLHAIIYVPPVHIILTLGGI